MSPSDLLLQWSIAAFIGLILHFKGRLGWVHATTFYLLFHLLAFCLRPTLLALGGFEGRWAWSPISPEPEHLKHALWISSAGLVAFTLGFLIGSRGAHAASETPASPFDRSDRRSLAATALLFGLPAIAFAGWSGDAGSLHDTPSLSTFWLLPLALLLILAGEWRWWSLVPLGCVAWWWSTQTPVAWSLPASLVGLLCLWMWAHPGRRPSLVAIVGVMAIAAALQLIDPGRILTVGEADEHPRVARSARAEFMSQLDWPAFAQFDSFAAAIATIPTESPHTRGTHVLEAWWTDSSAHSPRVMHARPDPAGQTATAPTRFPVHGWISHGWISGGWVGVVLLLGVTGLLLGWAHAAQSRRAADPAMACLFASSQAFGLLLLLGGNAHLIVAPAIAAVPMVTWRFLAGRLRRAEIAVTEREHLREEREKRRLWGHALLHPESGYPTVPQSPPPEPVAGQSDEVPAASTTLPHANAPGRPHSPWR